MKHAYVTAVDRETPLDPGVTDAYVPGSKQAPGDGAISPPTPPHAGLDIGDWADTGIEELKDNNIGGARRAFDNIKHQWKELTYEEEDK